MKVSNIKNVISNIFYMSKKAYQADKILLFILALNIITDSLLPLPLSIIPKYIIDNINGSASYLECVYLILLLFAINFIIRNLNIVLDGVISCKTEKLIQQQYKDFSDKIMSMDLSHLENPKINDDKQKAQNVITWNSKNIDGIKNGVGGVLLYSIRTFAYALIIVQINILFIVPFIVIIFANSKLNTLANQKTRKIYEEKISNDRRWNYLQNLTSDISFGKLIRANNLSNWIFTKIKLNRVENIKFEQKTIRIQSKSGFITTILAVIQEATIYFYLALMVYNGKISIGSFFMYFTAVNGFVNSFKNMFGYAVALNDTSVYVNDFRKFLDIPNKMDKIGDIVIDKNTPFTIKFENVSFSYPNTDRLVLKNINVVLTSDEIYSVVGDNGAGKTTFIKLLMRLYDPTEGNIYINDINIKDIDYASYISIFSPVFQDYQIYSFSILENIVFEEYDNLSEEKHKKALNALRDVGAYDFLDKLNEKEYTLLGKNFDKNGTDISGGEKQKIAIARSIYRDSNVVILDEPTANLSPKSEKAVYDLHRVVIRNKMCIYISHRMSNSQNADKILVFDRGEIVENGKHNNLIEKKGIYYSMYNQQAELYE